MSLLKGLSEQRAALRKQLEDMLVLAKTENRAFSEEENKSFRDIEDKIRLVDETISAEERARGIKGESKKLSTTDGNAEVEDRAFSNFILGKTIELRTGEQNFTQSNNSAIMPKTIAARIIETVKDICPILAGAERYSVKGKLSIPVYGKANTTHDIAAAYQTEFTEMTADAGKFTTVDLEGWLIGALTLIGTSVESNSQFSVTDFVIKHMSEEIAAFLSKEGLTGTGTKAIQGALNSSTGITAAAATAVTADELIALQTKVKQRFQSDACWTMHPDTFLAVKKLKDSQSRYLLQDNFAGEFPYMILGKPVYLDDNMPTLAAGNKAILYGTYSGMSFNFRENLSLQVLREKYATQHAIGVCGFCEVDGKITDNQRLAVLTMKASS